MPIDQTPIRARAYEAMVEHARDYAVVLLDPTGIITTWTSAAERMKGFTSSDVLGTHFRLLYSTEDQKQGRPEHVLGMAQKHGRFHEEVWRQRKDGSLFWASSEVIAIPGVEGAPCTYCKVTRDLSDLKLLEIKLEQERARAHAVLDAICEGVVALLPDGNVDYINPRAEDLTGWSSKDATGKKIEEVVRIVDLPELSSDERELLCSVDWRNAGRKVQVIISSDGGRHVVEMTTSPTRGANNEEEGAVIVLRDVTSELESKRSLRRANEQLVLAAFGARDRQVDAEASMARQNEFLSMLAHELRNPLQPIAHANALLGRLGPAAPGLPRIHAVINRQLESITRLVEDLLDASRISSGKISLKLSRLRLSEVIALAVETSQPQIEKSRQRLIIENTGEDMFVQGDMLRLAQVLSNLLNNASKFSAEEQSIRLETSVNGLFAQISIIDHGVGISAGLLPRVFDLFTQGPQALDRSKGGLGIGLTLVRSLVEMQGGIVRAESEGLGHGSRFTVALPLALPASEIIEAPKIMAPTRALRILVAEDNVDANELLSCLLQDHGHLVATCFNGEDAVEIARSEQFDLVLCDIGLPGLDGYAVVKRIQEACKGAVPVCIALSGYNRVEDRVHAMSCGFDHYLVKPIDFAVLQDFIAMHVR
jgi:PAS domain S-box-containing protein